MAAIEDFNPWKIVFPFFLAGSISSYIVDYSMQTRAESSVTRKSLHLKTESTSSVKSVIAGLGSVFENEIDLIVDKCKSSNQATTLK